MVEGLLEELMAELGVTQEQFVEACSKATKNPIHKKIVDQISAVDNFLAFKKLMNKRNEELNQQALAMLTAKEAKNIMDAAKKEESKAVSASAKNPTTQPPAQAT